MHHPFRDMRAALSEKESQKRPDYAGIGQMLRDTRESYGIPLEQAARDLKIKTSYLKFLESGQLESIPGMVYAKGYLRLYAEYLRVNLDTMLTLVRPVTAVKERAQTYSPAQEPKRLQQAVMASLVILLVAFLAWNFLGQEQVAKPVIAVRPLPKSLLAETSGMPAFHTVPKCFAKHAPAYPACFAVAEFQLPRSQKLVSVMQIATLPAWRWGL